MKQIKSVFTILPLTLLVGSISQADLTGVRSATRDSIKDAYGHIPMSFEQNQGQTDRKVRFISRGAGFSLFLTPTSAVLSLASPAKSGSVSSAMFVNISGANANAKISGIEPKTGRINYLGDANPKKWRTNVPTFGKVKYEGIYPGIDLVYYGNQNQLEYDFIVKPNGNPSKINLKIDGAKPIIGKSGSLSLKAANGLVRMDKPTIYQMIDGQRRLISGSFIQRSNGKIGFQIGSYDHSKELVIDPTLAYSSFLGGSTFEIAYAVAVDAAGCAYVAGQTQSSDFPTTAGAYRTSNASNNSCGFVTKFNSSGSGLVYSTYLGSTGGSFGARCMGISVDVDGHAFVTGPVVGNTYPTTTGAFQTTRGSNKPAFWSKLSADGSSLLYSTYLTGNGIDFGTGIRVDDSGNVYVSGYTTSTNFPTTASGFQTVNNSTSSNNGYVLKFTPNGSLYDLAYGTYFGGSGDDRALSLAIDGSGGAAIAGSTTSSNLPVKNAAQGTKTTGTQGFVAKFDTTSSGNSSESFATFIQGSSGAYSGNYSGSAFDSSGNVFASGLTTGPDLPVTSNAYQKHLGGSAVSSDAYLAKYGPTGTLLAMTYLGGSNIEMGSSLVTDLAGNVYLGGWSRSTLSTGINVHFPEVNSIDTSPTGHNSGTNIMFVAAFNSDLSSLLFSTLLGGTGPNDIYAITADPTGAQVYITGQAESNFPTTAGAFQTTSAGAFLSRIGYPVTCPAPTISSLSPSSVTAGSAGYTLTVNGTYFQLGAVVNWNGSPLTTTRVSTTQLTASVSAALIDEGGTAIVNVSNPDGQASSDSSETINFPAPSLTSISPSSAVAGGATFTLDLTGTSFYSSSVARWNGSDLSTTFVSRTHLQATVPSSLLVAGPAASVTVLTPTPGGGTSGAQSFVIDNPVPTLINTSPNQVAAGAPSFTLTANGVDFVSGATINWNGTPLTTTFVSSTQLTATVDASNVVDGGTVNISVSNPTPGGGTSGNVGFDILNPVPSLTSVTPTKSVAGTTGFTVTANGTNFVASATVNWNGSALPTTFVSSTKLTATVGASQVAMAGTSSVSVTNPAPGGGTTSTKSIVVNNPVPKLVKVYPISTPAGGPDFTITVKGAKFFTTSVVRFNGVDLTTSFVNSGTLTATVPSGLIATAGSIDVTVFNPTPGGGVSTPVPFTVTQTTLYFKIVKKKRNAVAHTITVTVSAQNVGYLVAASAQITTADLGGTGTSTTMPRSLGDIAAGATVTFDLVFPDSVGVAGASSTLNLAGDFTGGAFTWVKTLLLP